MGQMLVCMIILHWGITKHIAIAYGGSKHNLRQNHLRLKATEICVLKFRLSLILIGSCFLLFVRLIVSCTGSRFKLARLHFFEVSCNYRLLVRDSRLVYIVALLKQSRFALSNHETDHKNDFGVTGWNDDILRYFPFPLVQFFFHLVCRVRVCIFLVKLSLSYCALISLD